MDAVAPLSFGTKAETLERLEGVLRTASVLPQLRATAGDWRRAPEHVLAALAAKPWGDGIVIVRSSARGEDGDGASLAGHYHSVLGVAGEEAFRQAVDTVVACLDHDEDQFFIQPMLTDVALAGVAFGRDPNTGGPYTVVNYDPTGRSTASVTGGETNDLETFIRHKASPGQAAGPMGLVAALMAELEDLFATDWLDIEFALDESGTLNLLQVRPIRGAASTLFPTELHASAVREISEKVSRVSRPHPYLLGPRTIFGVMPDWNPAEIIGLRPRPLALSLYRDLVTNSIWAYQRDNYGYRNLRSFPLLIDFHGLPYIDVRVSLNSFVPQEIDEDLAERLVAYYLDRLEEEPTLHDKVEFEIIFSCYTFDLHDRLATLGAHGFGSDDQAKLAESLRSLTNRIIDSERGLWRRDLARIDELEQRYRLITESDLETVSRIYWLLEDCKRYGTLPFAGLARAGFIAVQVLGSLVTAGVISSEEREAFVASLDTVGSRLERDFRELGREDFLARYGHLRPGTYDILSPRYDEQPDVYFDWSAREREAKPRPTFTLSLSQLRRLEDLLAEHGISHSALGLLEFIKGAIEGREYAKFVFSRSLSQTLSLFWQLGAGYGFGPDDCSYADIGVIHELYMGSGKTPNLLNESIQIGKRRHALTRHLALPPLIVRPEDVWSFHLPPSAPNFITQAEVTAPVVAELSDPAALDGAVVMIPSADPGFDWIFTRAIAGFVTQFGGVNSHMAIRAGELGIPAVVGAGESRFSAWSNAQLLRLDCAGRKVAILRRRVSR